MRSSSEVVKGLAKMRKRLKELDFIAKPAGPFLREWKEDYRRFAAEFAPKWSHGVERSIQTSQDSKAFPLWARVYSDNPVARWADLGTGRLSEDPNSSKQAYFPPPERLRAWATDYGLDPYAVAHGIAERGGTPPTHFFRRAEEAANATMNERLARFAGGIIKQAGAEP